MYITSLREGLAKHYYSSADTQTKQKERERAETQWGEDRGFLINYTQQLEGRQNGDEMVLILKQYQEGNEVCLPDLKDQRKTRCIWNGIEFEVYKVHKLAAELEMNECDLIQTCKPTY